MKSFILSWQDFTTLSGIIQPISSNLGVYSTSKSQFWKTEGIPFTKGWSWNCAEQRRDEICGSGVASESVGRAKRRHRRVFKRQRWNRTSDQSFSLDLSVNTGRPETKKNLYPPLILVQILENLPVSSHFFYHINQ